MEDVKSPQMLTIRDTAALFNLPIHFVRQKVNSGEVVAVRAGRKFLVNADSVTAFLSTGIPQGTPPKAAPHVENAPRITPISLK